jgi:hypothetical protein
MNGWMDGWMTQNEMIGTPPCRLPGLSLPSPKPLPKLNPPPSAEFSKCALLAICPQDHLAHVLKTQYCAIVPLGRWDMGIRTLTELAEWLL